MRVSDKLLYNTVSNNLQQNLEKMLKLQENTSSGKSINRPSDDPTGVMKVIDYDTAISKSEQYQRNVGTGISFLSATESAIDTTQDILIRAKEISISALNGTNGASERSMMAKEVEQIYQQVIQIANTRVGERYIFAGYNTGAAPYDDSSGDYTGTDEPDGDIKVEIYSGSTIAINMPGYRVFGPSISGTDIVGALDDLKLALESNDVAGIEDAMSNVDSGIEQLNNVRAEIGAKMNRLDAAEDFLSKLEVDLITYKSEIEDVDITQVITELAMQHSVIEASRAAVARVLSQSLLDFLK